MTRAILIVLDSVGCGGAEDAKTVFAAPRSEYTRALFAAAFANEAAPTEVVSQ